MNPAAKTAPKCAGCGAHLKFDSLACCYCGLHRSIPLHEPRAGYHRQLFVFGFVTVATLLGTLLLLRDTHAPAPVPPAVTAVYITPQSLIAPIQAEAPPVDPRVAKPTSRKLVLQATTQMVELPREVQFVHLKTEMLGATTGGGPFEIKGTDREPVIGFRVTTARWDNKSIVRTLQPVYASDHSVVTRSMFVARQGYAVGGVIVDGDDHVTAMRIVFMQLQTNGLAMKNAYYSDWIGEPTGDPTHLLGGHGQYVTGIYGRKGMNVDALGLLLLDHTIN